MEASISTLFSAVNNAKGAFRLKLRRASSTAWLKKAIESAAPMIFDKVARRAVQKYWRWRRGLTLGVRGIVSDSDGRILLVRQTYAHGWMLPGGGVEFGESLDQSLARELDEEAGIAIDGAAELMGIYDNRSAFPGDHVAMYVVRHWHRTRATAPNMEIAEIGFFRPDALPETINPGSRRRIEEMLGLRVADSVW
jgi:ADP-ribose pyrophosphatase YjhB (NUDIX family)